MKRVAWRRAGVVGLLLVTVILALLWAAGFFNRGGQLQLVDRKDPQTYLNTIEPGRVFQAAQPAQGVPRLRPLGATRQRMAQGSSVSLRVTAPPNMPVTFTSFDAGAFENQLASTTVAANEAGVAEARFTATPGVVGRVNILAASPVASGQSRFVVNVSRPASAPAVPVAGPAGQ